MRPMYGGGCCEASTPVRKAMVARHTPARAAPIMVRHCMPYLEIVVLASGLATASHGVVQHDSSHRHYTLPEDCPSAKHPLQWLKVLGYYERYEMREKRILRRCTFNHIRSFITQGEAQVRFFPAIRRLTSSKEIA